MNKRIYIYVTPYFPKEGRHFGSYGYDFVQALRRNSDFDVRVFVAGDGSEYDFEGCHVYQFPVKNLPSALFPYLYAKRNAKSFIKAVKKAGINLEDVAVCHGNTATYSIYPLELKGYNSRCLTILHHHDLDGFGLRLGMFRHLWIHKVINFFIVRKLFEKMDCHVFISEASRNSTVQFPYTNWSYYEDYRRLGRGLGLFRPAKIKNPLILWNGVEDSKFCHSATRNKKRETNIFRIGCVGNFVEVKDHISLIKAVLRLKAVIPGLSLEFVGTSGVGNFYAKAERFVEENHLGDIIEFFSNVSHSKMADYYKRWNLMVLPSYFEGFGCVYIESWACGTPFMACKGQGIEDVLSEGEKEKWLIKPHDVDDIVRKIYNYYQNQDIQVLKKSISIDKLVAEFVVAIGEL